jgi:hypothetical protein
MYLSMGPVTEAVYRVMNEQQPLDRADYALRLAELPGDWPPPEELGLRPPPQHQGQVTSEPW